MSKQEYAFNATTCINLHCIVRDGFALREEKPHSYQTRQHPSGVSDSRTSIRSISMSNGVDAAPQYDPADDAYRTLSYVNEIQVLRKNAVKR